MNLFIYCFFVDDNIQCTYIHDKRFCKSFPIFRNKKKSLMYVFSTDSINDLIMYNTYVNGLDNQEKSCTIHEPFRQSRNY